MFENKKNEIMAVVAGNRGAGVTWFGTALSQAFAYQHQKTLFFDADGGAENIAYQMGLKKSNLYADMLKGHITINHAVTTFSKGKFDLIYANPNEPLLNGYSIGRSQILALDLKNLASKYDDLILDCSGADTFLKNILISTASSLILIVEPGNAGAVGAYEEIERLKKIVPNTKIFVVVNHALTMAEGEQVFKTIADAASDFMNVSLDLLGVICQDGRIRECINNKMTLWERYPVSELLEQLSKMTERLKQGD